MHLRKAYQIEVQCDLNSGSTLTNLSANNFKLGRLGKALGNIREALKQFDALVKHRKKLNKEELSVYAIAYLNYVTQLKFAGKMRSAKDVAKIAVGKLKDQEINKFDKVFGKLKIESESKLRRPHSHMPSKNKHFSTSHSLRSRSKFDSSHHKRLRVKSAKKRPMSVSKKNTQDCWKAAPKLEGWVTGKSDLRSGVDLYPRYCLNEITAKKVLYVCDQFSHEIDKGVRGDRVTVGRVVQTKRRYGPYTQIAPRWKKIKKGDQVIMRESKNYQLKGRRLFGGTHFYRMKPRNWGTIKRIRNYDKKVGYQGQRHEGGSDARESNEEEELLDESWEEDFDNPKDKSIDGDLLDNNVHSRKEFVRGLERVNKKQVEKEKDEIERRRIQILKTREKLKRERIERERERERARVQMQIMKEMREEELKNEIEQVEELRQSLKSIKGMRKSTKSLERKKRREAKERARASKTAVLKPGERKKRAQQLSIIAMMQGEVRETKKLEAEMNELEQEYVEDVEEEQKKVVIEAFQKKPNEKKVVIKEEKSEELQLPEDSNQDGDSIDPDLNIDFNDDEF